MGDDPLTDHMTPFHLLRLAEELYQALMQAQVDPETVRLELGDSGQLFIHQEERMLGYIDLVAGQLHL